MEEYLKAFNIFSDKEIEEVIELGTYQELKKNDFFTKEGDISSSLAFVKDGIFRSYYLSQSEEEITYCLTFPNSFITAYSSYISQEKTKINIQAMTDIQLISLPKSEMDSLVNSSKNWLLFFKIITEQYYIALENRVFQLQTEKAETRYKNLITHRPEYIQKVPLQYLASYLGITQRHLSRLRANISF
ncbi:MAG: cAMP-binding protein [Thalassobius sp.]|nr:cAMP-binding protein [Thalassovita sp.]